MSEHVYRIIQLAGSSTQSFEDAIAGAISQAARSVQNMRWFEVAEMRGHIQDQRVAHYQVVLRVGFTLDDGLS